MEPANPFVYGEIVTAAAFADRDAERERLTEDLAAGQKVFLISPRRYGKSSLIRDVMRALARRKILTVEVTVAASSSYVGFLESYARALVIADTPVSGLRRWATDLLQSLRPEVRVDARPGDGGFSVAFPTVRTPREVARLATEVFALPGKIADTRKQRMAIALDEFQSVTTFDGGAVEHALRAAVQDQRQVGYVFAGSEPSLMERMLTSKRPFYKAGPVMRLDKIDDDMFAAFIDERLASTGFTPEEGLGDAIVDEHVTCTVGITRHQIGGLGTERDITPVCTDRHAAIGNARRFGAVARHVHARGHGRDAIVHEHVDEAIRVVGHQSRAV